jgi:hypothetical protein
MLVFNPRRTSVHPLLLDELLVGAGLRLATAGERQGHAGRSVG